MSNDVKVERAESLVIPVVLTLSPKTALRLSGLLVNAVSFEDNEDLADIHNGIEEAVSEMAPSFVYDEDSGFFVSDGTGDLDE